MRVSKITIGRLYNLGSYEHVSYKLSVEVAEGESAGTALLGVEKILNALNPKTHTNDKQELDRMAQRLDALQAMDDEAYQRENRHVTGTRKEYTDRVAKAWRDAVLERALWERRQSKARKLLDDLGGAANWKDAKMDWEDEL